MTTACGPDWDELPALLTVEEAAAALRVSVQHVYRMIRTHQIPHSHYGRVIRIDRQALRRGDAPTHTHGPAPESQPIIVSSSSRRHSSSRRIESSRAAGR